MFAPEAYHELPIYAGMPVPSMEVDYQLLLEGVDLVFRQERQYQEKSQLIDLIKSSKLAFNNNDEIKARTLLMDAHKMIGKIK